MIRFIDLRGQHTGYRFAFFSTVTDSFISCGGDQVFDTWEEFEKVNGEEMLERCKSLCPEWVFHPVEAAAKWYDPSDAHLVEDDY